jgi:hypothetical protein
MKRYAYIQSVNNKKKKTSANKSYIQVVTEDMEVYFFTESELERAQKRAKSNPEDQDLVEVSYERVSPD